jgi:hypothetical protein
MTANYEDLGVRLVEISDDFKIRRLVGVCKARDFKRCEDER